MESSTKLTNTSNSWRETLAGTGLFILWGLALIISALPLEQEIPPWVFIYLLLGLLILPSIGMCIGWIKGFPRWSYPYVGHVITFSVFLTNISFPDFREEVWAWHALIPLGGAIAIAILVTRSVDPIIKFFTNIWDDWTLLTFGMFGLMPLLVFISFDEVDRLYSLYFMVILSLLMIGVALLYMRADNPRNRVIILLTGIIPTIAISVIAPSIYWQRLGWMFPLQSVILGSIVLLFMFSPALIGLLNRAFTRPETA